jgi:hypothetical protein
MHRLIKSVLNTDRKTYGPITTEPVTIALPPADQATNDDDDDDDDDEAVDDEDIEEDELEGDGAVHDG